MGRLLLGAFSYSTNNALSYFQRFDSFYIGHCYLLHSSLGIGRNKGRLLSIFKKDGICSIGFVRHPNPYRYDNRYQKKYIKHIVIKHSDKYNRIGIFCLVFQFLILQVRTARTIPLSLLKLKVKQATETPELKGITKEDIHTDLFIAEPIKI